ncbi:MAG: UDP-3-O-(3-hydroxymyristoyl)glucosamine N-acyltransferase [Candidatus Marinimicrobia bacterium CG08_land_8_20_14_0_20_45_22]|nr:MAG: UDP-3-O-(3-hydroxymyristoyl)glucosamine N-acyltransferase [Candidatus Marinimicrobia bacterium CG08_land_8_20_14_0_20_45_22]
MSLQKIAELVGGKVDGDGSLLVRDLAEIQHAGPGELSFLGNPKYVKFLATTRATAILVEENFKEPYPNLIRVPNVNFAYSRALAIFRPEASKSAPGIAPTAIIAPDAVLGKNVHIGAHVVIADKCVIGERVYILSNSVIGRETQIGDDTLIYPNVSVYHRCRIGKRVIIHSGAVVGSDGFGFVRVENSIEKIPQAGGVIICDDVEIGANTTVDRGTLGDTVIGKGTKIDNLVQIAHNVKIGEYCFLAGQSGVAGSTIIEDDVTIAGQVGIAGHLHIGAGAIIAAQAGVSKDIPTGAVVIGSPAQEKGKVWREMANIRSIPDIKEKIKQLELKASQEINRNKNA